MNNLIKYSSCWEDAHLLASSLEIDIDSRIMSIASGGDNSLFLLTKDPESLLSLDLNPDQIRLMRIKEHAIKYLDYEEFLEFMGFRRSSRRKLLLNKLEPYLSEDEVNLYRQMAATGPLVESGKFERYLHFFAKKILPFIHGRRTIDELLSEKSADRQLLFYNEKWNTFKWRLLFKVFFSRWVMGRFGREPEKFNEVRIPVSTTIYKRAGSHLSSVLCQRNFMLHYILKGSFDILPPYAQPEAFEKIKTWLQRRSIQYYNGDVLSALKVNEGYNRFNLSNIFEYMSQEDFVAHSDQFQRVCEKSSVFCYWSLLVDRKWQSSAIRQVETQPEDRGFFYQRFHKYTLK